MAQTGLSRLLSAQDAAFLYFEKEEAPMHIGSIAVFDGDVSVGDNPNRDPSSTFVINNNHVTDVHIPHFLCCVLNL